MHRRERRGPEGPDRRQRVTAEVVDVDATEPRRGALLSNLQEVVVCQRDQRQPGLDFADSHQRAPVEALDRDLAQQAGVASLRDECLNELLARRGLTRSAGLNLGLDVECDVVGAIRVHEVEHLAQ